MFDNTENTPWEEAEWERIVNAPERQAEGDMRAADRDEILANFHERSEQRRKERIQIAACRYTAVALACGLLSYAFGHYGISWLAWVMGAAAGAFAITASYVFGRSREM